MIVDLLQDFFDIISAWILNGDIRVVLTVLVCLAIPVFFLYNALLRSTMVGLQQMLIKDKNILYIIAHPDDETM